MNITLFLKFFNTPSNAAAFNPLKLCFMPNVLDNYLAMYRI